MKCAKCNTEKQPEEFRLRKSVCTGKNYRGKVCQECHQAKSREWRRANPDKVRKYNKAAKAKNPEYHAHKAIQNHYKRKFGITLEHRDEMLRAQNGMCLICKTTKPSRRGWCVDHDHTSGRIRGILCAPCNSFIGLAKERIDVLENAITYIEACNVARNDYSE